MKIKKMALRFHKTEESFTGAQARLNPLSQTTQNVHWSFGDFKLDQNSWTQPIGRADFNYSKLISVCPKI